MSNDAGHGSSPAVLSLAGIREAADRISPHTQVTPVLTCGALDEMSGREVFFKCEQFQKTGSFKARGACNAVMLTSKECPCVVTHSSGNHAQVPHLRVTAGFFLLGSWASSIGPIGTAGDFALCSSGTRSCDTVCSHNGVGDTCCRVFTNRSSRHGLGFILSRWFELLRLAVKQKKRTSHETLAAAELINNIFSRNVDEPGTVMGGKRAGNPGPHRDAAELHGGQGGRRSWLRGKVRPIGLDLSSTMLVSSCRVLVTSWLKYQAFCLNLIGGTHKETR